MGQRRTHTVTISLELSRDLSRVHPASCPGGAGIKSSPTSSDLPITVFGNKDSRKSISATFFASNWIFVALKTGGRAFN